MRTKLKAASSLVVYHARLMRILTILFILGSFCVAGQANTKPVGWRFSIEWDATRQYASAEGDLGTAQPGRPVAITLWYPADEGGVATPIADLARLGAYQRHGHPPPAAFEEASVQALKDTMPTALSALSRGRRDAPVRTGKHPLVFFAHATPLAQYAMAEAMASQGFVVAGLMSRGAKAGAYRLSIDDIRAMSEDLEFALRQLRSLPYVDGSRVGVIGMSNGALGAVGLANKVDVRAIVSLDGTVGEQAATRVLPELANAASPVSNPPLLHLYTTPNPYLDFANLHKRTTQCVTVRIPDVRHADFLSYAVLRPTAPGEQPTRAAVTDKFAAIQRLTGEFLSQRS